MNNAGIFNDRAIAADQSNLREQMQAAFNTNVFGAAVVTDAFVPWLERAASPCIIFMSSGLASLTDTLDPSYEFYAIGARTAI